MDTAKVDRTISENVKSNRSFAKLVARIRLSRFYRLEVKLILPYVLLTMMLAAVGFYIITRLVVDTQLERLNNMMMDASGIASDGIVLKERQQLEKLRFLVFTDGMAQAVYNIDSAKVAELMLPVFANSSIDIMTAINANGEEILTLGRDPETSQIQNQQGRDFSILSSVQLALKGKPDPLGDKFVEIVKSEDGKAFLLTTAPLRDSEDRIVGVMVVGSHLDSVLKDLKDQALTDLILLDNENNVISTTFTQKEEGFQSLVDLIGGQDPTDTTQLFDVTLNKRDYLIAYSPFIVREQWVGWLGVIENREYWVSPAITSRGLYLGLFTAGTFLMIIIGYILSQDIARPLLRLRKMSQAVAEGDLEQQIGLIRADEIGDLGNAFDMMTHQLQERTAEAERLHAETLQRNKELSEINAKLEAMQLQLIQSEKLASIGQLTAGIVHDVKNPFAVIMGMAEVLAEDDSIDETTRHGLKVMRESAVKGNTIVSDLLKFARQSQPEMRTLDLRETVQASLRLTAYLTRRFNLSTELPETPVMVTYDAQQIEQVLINMIHNAVQAMPEKGALDVALKQVDGTARVSIKDTGCGISADHLKRIFDPFFTTKPEGEGTGLGLSVSYGIIRNHNGRIDVESEVGKGTMFTIVLPVSQLSLTSGETYL